MKEVAELAGCLTCHELEDASHVTLVGEAGVGGEVSQVSPTALERAADILYPQAVHVFGHGAAVAFAKDARQVDGMNLYLLCDAVQCQRFAEAAVQQFGRAL